MVCKCACPTLPKYKTLTALTSAWLCSRWIFTFLVCPAFLFFFQIRFFDHETCRQAVQWQCRRRPTYMALALGSMEASSSGGYFRTSSQDSIQFQTRKAHTGTVALIRLMWKRLDTADTFAFRSAAQILAGFQSAAAGWMWWGLCLLFEGVHDKLVVACDLTSSKIIRIVESSRRLGMRLLWGDHSTQGQMLANCGHMWINVELHEGCRNTLWGINQKVHGWVDGVGPNHWGRQYGHLPSSVFTCFGSAVEIHQGDKGKRKVSRRQHCSYLSEYSNWPRDRLFL